MEKFDFVVVGGGIGGVVCVETLCELISPSPFSRGGRAFDGKQPTVCLISASPEVKMTVNLRRLTNMIEEFDLAENPISQLQMSWPTELLTVKLGFVRSMQTDCNRLILQDDTCIEFGQLCIATGGVPMRLPSSEKSNDRILTLRDTESVCDLQTKLDSTRRLVVVGNGGIATEVVHEIQGCEVVWLVKHSSISTPFLDPDAAKFLIESRQAGKISAQGQAKRTVKKMRYNLADDSKEQPRIGPALGPDWAQGLNLKGADSSSSLKILYRVEVSEIFTKNTGPFDAVPSGSDLNSVTDWPLCLKLTDGSRLGCDLVISAIGVRANVDMFGPGLRRASEKDGAGLLVNEQMQTSNSDIYAVGDAAMANWENRSKHWFQMKLWSQARSMGFQAAKSMLSRFRKEPVPPPLDIAFEMFTHVTTFFGFKVVMLGLYNGQGMNLSEDQDECYVLLRITPSQEYVKCIMQNGKMQGALLIGETDLEETFENLILDQLDIKDTEDGLLDPDIDIDDYYD